MAVCDTSPSPGLAGFPGAVLRFTAGPDNYRLVDANHAATSLLAVPVATLTGDGFAGGLFGRDADVLAEALAGATAANRSTVLRWGAQPTVTFLGVDLFRTPDGDVLVAIDDRTDQHRLDALLAGSNTAIQTYDDDGKVAWVSAESLRSIGATAAEYVGLRSFDLTHPDDIGTLLRVDREMRASPGREVVARWRVSHPTIPDTWYLYRSSMYHLPDDPAIGGTVALGRSVLASTGESDSPTGTALSSADVMPSGLLVSGDGRLQYRNPPAQHLLGPSVDGDDPYAWVGALDPDHREVALDALTSAATRGRRSTLTTTVERPGTDTIWLRIESAPSFDAVGNHVGYVATLVDITPEQRARRELERTHEQLWQMANHDPLTGLANRARGRDRLDHALARTRREGRTTAVLSCDLDHFKEVNDRFGHVGGDLLLVEIGRRLNRSVRSTDTVCRVGGDEFLVICEAFDSLADLEALSRRLITAVNAPMGIGDGTATIGVCIGIAVASAASTTDDLLARSDAAAYAAKRAGKNTSITAPPVPTVIS